MTTTQTAPQIEQDAIKDVTPDKNYFVDLSAVDVSNYIEKKNGFSYLSWAFAVDQLKRRHPDAQIITKRFPDPEIPGQMVPFQKTSLGYFVEVEVIIDGVSVSEPFPVLDYRNKPIAQPTAMDINKSLQRAKVKAIAGHGLGLYIYAGEDLPIDSDEAGPTPQETQFKVPSNANPNLKKINVISDAQKQSIRELSNELASLNLGKNANDPEQKKEAIRLIMQAYNVTATMTMEQANHAIAGMQGEIKHIHDQRMAAAAAAQAPQNQPVFDAPSDDLNDLI